MYTVPARFLCYVACWLLFIAALPSAADNVVGEVATFRQGQLALASHLSVWAPDGEVDEYAMVTGQYDQEFQRPKTQYLAQGKNNWIRFALHNPDKQTSQWVLNLQTAMIESVTLLSLQPSGAILRLESGLRFGYDKRQVPYHHFAFPLQQASDSTQVYYLKINTPIQLYLAPSVLDHPSFLETATFNVSLGYLFIGVLVGVLVYLIVLYLGPESRHLVSRFVWFVFFSMLVMLYVNGFLMAYLPASEWWTIRLWLILHVCLQTSYLLVSQHFFQTGENYPRIHRYMSLCIVSALLFFVLVFIVPYNLLAKAELYFVAHLILAIAVISCYIWWHEGNKVMLFAWGNLGLMLTAALSTYAALGSLAASDWIVQHGFEVGFCWQAILFTWALSRKINERVTAAAVVEAESKGKSEFMAKMSHEIRTPMNGVLGMVQLLKKTPVTPEQQHYLNVIDSSGKTLLTVINDVLDFSKLAAGKVELHPQIFNLRVLLSEIDTLFREVAREKDVSFHVLSAPNLPEHLSGDSIRLRQILANLLSNAVKFTDHGSVTLTVAVAEMDSKSGERVALRFIVRDTGMGISEQDQQRLFQSFSQLGIHSEGGSGLGLAICKQLVEMMGGSISVWSQPGQGSEFSFSIWLQRVEENVPRREDNQEWYLMPLRVLVAEDNEVNREVISTFLTKLGCEVQSVINGKMAVEYYRLNTKVVDVILMDAEMPVMDGISASRSIRAWEKEKGLPPVRIIALTAHATAAHHKACMEAGMSDYLSKPVSFEQLQQILMRKPE